MLQFIYEGEEYTTRYRLEQKYNITHKKLQVLLQRSELTILKDLNKFYFLKSEVEGLVEASLKK